MVTPVYPRSLARGVSPFLGGRTPGAPFSELCRLADSRKALAWAQPAASLRYFNSRLKTQPPAVLRQALGSAWTPSKFILTPKWGVWTAWVQLPSFPGDTPASWGPALPLLNFKPFEAITKSEATLPLAREGPLWVPTRVGRPPRSPGLCVAAKAAPLSPAGL